jgi:hypothetical protein
MNTKSAIASTFFMQGFLMDKAKHRLGNGNLASKPPQDGAFIARFVICYML